jgi:hypothetical protein
MRPGMRRVLAGFSKAAAASALVGACTWTSLDAVGPSPGIIDADAHDVPVPPDAAGAIDAPASDAASFACGAPSTSTTGRAWTFDSTAESWTVELDDGVQATPAWTGSFGDPDAGALQIDVTPDPSVTSLTGGWLHVTIPSVDLSHFTVSAWAWLDDGPSPHLKTFVQTGTMYKWADNGTFYLQPHEWTCLSLAVSMPAYSQPQYDPTKVVSIGFEMLGTAPFRLVFDTVRYD